MIDTVADHIFGKCSRPTNWMELDYFKGRWVDSFGLITLVADLEAELHVEFTFEEIGSSEFRSVAGIARIVERKKA